MRERKQNGTVIEISGRWYVRYYQHQNVGGTLQRKRLTHCLGAVTTRGRHAPADIIEEADRFMASINRSQIPAERIVSLADFVENVYLPGVKESKKPSTHHGYRDAWENHLKAVTSRDRMTLKDVKTYTVQKWLNQIGRENLSRNSLKRIQSVLSGVFKEAKRLGFYEGVNPVQDTAVNPKAAEPKETVAYTLEEIDSILAVLPEPAATVFAVASYTGLRRGEIEALDWSDFKDGHIQVSRSIWNGRVSAPKTRKSCAAVPAIPRLADRLEIHRLRCGSPQVGPMFHNSVGQPLSVNNLLNRQILPALNKCRHCGVAEGKAHLKQDHDYQRDDRIPEWQGFHAARRGLASNLYRLGVPDKTIQKILRHSDVSVTLGYYIKSTSLDVVEAMDKLEENLAAKSAGQILQDSERTPSVDRKSTRLNSS